MLHRPIPLISLIPRNSNTGCITFQIEDSISIYIINILNISHFSSVSARASGLRFSYFVYIQINLRSDTANIKCINSCVIKYAHDEKRE